MQVLEEILKSMMHTHIARITLQCPDNISFVECNEDVFLTPYFELMKKLESLKNNINKNFYFFNSFCFFLDFRLYSKWNFCWRG